MSKNDQHAIIVLLACNTWLKEHEPSGSSEKYHKTLLNMTEERLNNYLTYLQRISGTAMKGSIGAQLEKKFKRLQKHVDKLFKVDTKWIPLLVASETLAIFFQDKKHYAEFYNHKFYDLYDYIGDDQKSQWNVMSDKALRLVEFVNRGCK